MWRSRQILKDHMKCVETCHTVRLHVGSHRITTYVSHNCFDFMTALFVSVGQPWSYSSACTSSVRSVLAAVSTVVSSSVSVCILAIFFKNTKMSSKEIVLVIQSIQKSLWVFKNLNPHMLAIYFCVHHKAASLPLVIYAYYCVDRLMTKSSFYRKVKTKCACKSMTTCTSRDSPS